MSSEPSIFLETLRCEIKREYGEVARNPAKGFHFHTGRPLAELLGYSDALLDGIPEPAVESLAGTGNPFALGPLFSGERVADLGCGAGMDSLIAARMVGAGRARLPPLSLGRPTSPGLDVPQQQPENRSSVPKFVPKFTKFTHSPNAPNSVRKFTPKNASASREDASADRPVAIRERGETHCQPRTT